MYIYVYIYTLCMGTFLSGLISCYFRSREAVTLNLDPQKSGPCMGPIHALMAMQKMVSISLYIII